MELEILQENLQQKVNIASRIISSKPQLPILSHLLFEATDRQFRLIASDLETSIIVPVSAKIISPGKFTVPARTFQEIISALTVEKIHLKVEESALVVSGGKFSGRIIGTSALDYPQVIPPTEDAATFEIETASLIGLIGSTSFATALDESRVALTGVLFCFQGEEVVLAATDGFRLSVARSKVSGKANADLPSLIIPSHALQEVSRLLSEKTEGEASKKVQIKILASNQIVFISGETEIYSRLISANFPDYEKIIPSSSEVKISLSTDELFKAVKLSSVFARENANIVRFTLESGKLIIKAQGGQTGEDQIELDIDQEGPLKEPLVVAFNYRYLLDFLTAVAGSKEVSIGLSGAIAPGVFQAAGSPNFLHIIMPVRVQV